MGSARTQYLVPLYSFENRSGTGELYRGFVACLEYNKKIDRSREVKRHGLSTEIYRREEKKVGAAKYTTDGEEVPVEGISRFSFSDLIMKIYTKVVLEG